MAKSPSPSFRVRRLHPEAALPRRMSEHSAGLDLAACLVDRKLFVIAPGDRALVPTGLALAIPIGYEGQVRPRSGLALRHGITVANSPGTIDADYRGELKVILINLGVEPFEIRHGERIAQLILAPVALLEVREVDVLPVAERGDGGFGSTGR